MRRRTGTWVTVALWAVMIAGFVALSVALLLEDRNGFAVAPSADGPSSPPALKVWDFAGDFARVKGSLHNPGDDRYGSAGVWAYMVGTRRARDPSSFKRLGRHAESLQGAQGFDVWLGPDGPATGVSFPIVGVRGVSPEGFAHPSETRSAIVAWTSPIRGRVTITGSVTDGDPRGGDGVVWVLRKGVRTLATGTLRNGGGRKPFGVSSVGVNAGETLYLKIAPRRSSGYDSTTFTLRIDEQRSADASPDQGSVRR
jgi:hypothetical protein